LGTEGNGLLLFDIPTGKVMERYTDANGLCNNAVHTIVKDGKGMLWLSTFNGLARFDPKRKSFSNFYQSDGLQSNQFNYRSAYKLRSGELMFGGIKGFNLFHPDSIVVRSFMPPLYITSIMINSKYVAVAGNDYISKRNAATIEELRIPYDEAILSIRFNALEYASPEKISYAYFLEGWDRGWTYAGNTRNINYNNLTEGSYVLHIKSTNAAGTWQEKETLLRIIVLPPWYRSWWAYSLYLLLAAGLGYVIYNYRIQQERLRYKINWPNYKPIRSRK
jgi:Y_Y_Y domain.